jgi:hypothetical protein
MRHNPFKTSGQLLLMTGILFFSNQLHASNKIIGRVSDTKKQPIEFATVTLLNAETKKLITGDVCNEKGEFVIDDLAKGTYTISVSMVGYVKNETETVVVDATKDRTIEKNIVLNDANYQLHNVEVVAEKKFIEQTIDKVIVNPNSSIVSASENVFEIMKKIPGVTIDNNDNIMLKGKQGVMVLIDDKPTYVSSDQLATLLKSMQGKNVDRIEIMENPPARYDAEGNSGIINIRTKHNKAPGINGSVNAGLNIAGKTGGNIGLDLNMNVGKLNVYGNYSFSDWDRWNLLEATRRFITTDLAGSYQFINSRNDFNGIAHNYKVGADYFIAKNRVISFMLRSNSGSNIISGKNISSFADVNKNIDSTLTTLSTTNQRWNSKTYNVNYKWDIDTIGSSFSVDADYAHFYFRSNSDQNSNYFDSIGNPMNRIMSINTAQGSDIDVLTARVDYVHPINKVFDFEAGLKSSFVTNNSKIDMNGFMNQSDNFIYQENIQALYVNGRAKFNKTSLQLGLRLENTNSTGNSISMNQVDTKSYLKLFPSFFVQQNLNPDNTINFRYSYRIGRPNYDMLNPFIMMLDPYTYQQGNPLLKPQFTYSTGLSYSYKGVFITSLGYNYTKDLYTQVLSQNDATKVIYETMTNLSNCFDFNASETFQLQPTKWWKLNSTITGLFNEVNSGLGENEQFKRWVLNANMSSNFSLPYKINMELNGYYSTKQLYGNFILKSNYCINLGFQRNILDDKGVIKVAVNDIFNTSNGGSYAKYSNINLDVKNSSDSRRLNISFSYRFGKDDFKTRANRSTSSSEEESRSSK